VLIASTCARVAKAYGAGEAEHRIDISKPQLLGEVTLIRGPAGWLLFFGTIKEQFAPT
jgi:hypothetical protein